MFVQFETPVGDVVLIRASAVRVVRSGSSGTQLRLDNQTRLEVVGDMVSIARQLGDQVVVYAPPAEPASDA